MGAGEEGSDKDVQEVKGTSEKSEKPTTKVSLGGAAASVGSTQKRFLEVPSVARGGSKRGNKEAEGVGRGGPLIGRSHHEGSGKASGGGIGRWTLIHHSPSPTTTGRTGQSMGSKVGQSTEVSQPSTNGVTEDVTSEQTDGVAQRPTGSAESSSSKCAVSDLVNHSDRDSAKTAAKRLCKRIGWKSCKRSCK